MNFSNVDKKYRPVPFWSWNEKLDLDETDHQIKEMETQGIGGFFMHARGGLKTKYMGDEWFKNVELCINRCRENGMHAWAYDENGWPSGFGNGIVNGKGLAFQQKYLRFECGEKNSETTITNLNGYHFYYDVNPLYIDTLSADAVNAFIQNIYKPYYDKYGNGLEGFFTDEPQISRNGIPWSFIIPDEYQKAYGENLLDKIDELFLETGTYTDTRVKFWKLVTNLFSKNYMKQIYDWCTERGLKFTGHLVLEDDMYTQVTTNGACMPHYEYLTIPGMDWLGRHNTPSLTPYQVASVARQIGKKQVLSETFALCGHNTSHDELKWIYEYQMVRGINLLCQHLQGYSNRGLRKRDYPPAMYIQQPWWKDYKMFNDAMSRTGMLLTEGEDGVDTLIIHPQATAWILYNDKNYYDPADKSEVTNIMKVNDALLDIIKTLEQKHINFHLGDEIIMERHGRVEGNRLIIGKKEYSKIIIPPHDILLDNTKELLRTFAANGGIITTADDLTANDIIDIAEITYCQRKCRDYNLYYFVNSTDNSYHAYIAKGNKRMDPVTGKLSDFDGHHTFKRHESLIVIDDFGERRSANSSPELTAIDLSGTWTIEKSSENVLTLDYCKYYFDGVLQEEKGYILNAMYRAIDIGKPVHIKCEFEFTAEYIAPAMYLGCETPEIFDIFVNGQQIDKTDCGYFADKSFRKLDIAKYLQCGKNIVTLEADFSQSPEVYENIEKSRHFETELNKLAFDMEIEQIYIIGDFGVDTRGRFTELDKNAARFSGEFVITKPKNEIRLSHIERQGFPFFAGEITVNKTFHAETKHMMLSFAKTGINVVKAKINGTEIRPFMWEPYFADVSELVREGKNKLELTLINNLRNMQGPLHLTEGESYYVCPPSFIKEKCIWYDGNEKNKWNDDYCFVDLSIR